MRRRNLTWTIGGSALILAGIVAMLDAVMLGSVLGYLDLLIPLAAGTIATVQIARTRIVPSPWRWAPLWVLGLSVLVGVITQGMYATLALPQQALADVATLLSALSSLAGTIGLGVLALILTERDRADSVHIFRSGHS
ncbi:hypothetical protein [Microbacterium sp. NPDC076895]|uniref:hypothetical protein n=1 Tax=Microbacterium sp. NPDC076895 TaxID=3154957 RepID=UPI00342E9DD9